ncbi:hypothetical protein [Aeromicrobium endophyticum]|uniref:DUF8094 domain-containing protein n=1 Tax=Aeromicrobium endophyticum TaxID=2292704 RepID=A0A371NZB9_9ACTN|nr:hypothetical protein [Aeromicrobium endophyticum]REK69029.1 hypothetical protein DX116_19455 [Aeromicrobium endophyticum]
MRRTVLALVCSLTLSACAVPHARDDVRLDKAAASRAEVDEVLDEYREVRESAVELLDPKPLSTVEQGAVLAIDTGSFEVLQRSATAQKGDDTGRGEVTDVEVPRFAKYPLWFYAVVRDAKLGINRVQVFERTSSVDPWVLTASPETLDKTELPPIRRSQGAALRVPADDGVGMAMSPQKAAQAYAAVLADPKAPGADAIADDSFIQQMRSTAETNAALKDVRFSQAWEAQDVQYALRTSDGGALAFVTLLRTDTYAVDDGLTVTWPEGTPQRAFLSAGISGSGTLTYLHQVLLYLPGGDGPPRALGQYGGVVSGEGDQGAVR